MSIPLGKTYHPDELERALIEHWRQERTFHKSVENRAQAKPFVFLEGPPTANGLPHPGHVLTRTLKDSVCRYKTMRGFRVERKAGWDCHGLPVEIEVEKELGLKSKKDIEAYGIAKFNQKCRESVFRYKKDWEWMSERVGFWLDFEKPYVTLTNEYIESVWWSLKEAFKKGLLVKGFRVAPSCPRCGTALSSHEVGLGYKSVEEASLFVKFKVKNRPNEYVLAWTTTPWTLPGNIALAVGEDIDYVRVEQPTPKGTETLVLAKERLEVLRPGYKVVSDLKGKELVGWAYEPLFDDLANYLQHEVAKGPPGRVDGVNLNWAFKRASDRPEHPGKLHTVVPANFVTTQDGTGVVHTAVMYGEDDFELGMSLGLPAVHTVDAEGKFKPFVRQFAGKFVKDADADVVEDLRSRNLLYRVKNHVHDYPFCWRCSTPLLYYARDQWFIRMSTLRERLVAHNATVQWVPAHIQDGRFGEFIRNVRDWALSRERYWGTPLPIWTCGQCHHVECVGSIEELVRLGGVPVKRLVDEKTLDLHKPAVDDIHLTCPKCQAGMDRETSVIDTWYDSGAAPFAQWHYPFENRDQFQTTDFVAEGIDQTRGWFYTLLAEMTFLRDQPAYRTCVVNGLVLDEKGQKMSKKLKNYTDPNLVFKEYGADAMRWYLLSSSAPYADKRFFPAAIKESLTRFFLTLWNTYQFFHGYAELDRWTPAAPAPPVAQRPLLDRWLLDRMDTVVRIAVDEADHYNLHKAATAVEHFLLNDLSNWWLRRTRRRFWSDAESADKAAAYATLHEALLTVCRLAAPFAPFLVEALYLHLRRAKDPPSVHHCDYPTPTARTEPTSIERAMADIRALVEAARSLRSKAGIKTRVPLPRLTVVRAQPASGEFRELLDVIRDEANVKDVVVAKTAQGLEDYEAKINPQLVGREFKTDAKPILEAARQGDPRVLGRALAKEGAATLAGRRLEARLFTITTVAAEGALKLDIPSVGTLFLDAHLTPELEAEGWARELVRRIQEMRKEANLRLDDVIETTILSPEAVRSSARSWLRYIQDETRSKQVRFDGRPPSMGLSKEWDIDGEKVTIGIAKVAP